MKKGGGHLIGAKRHKTIRLIAKATSNVIIVLTLAFVCAAWPIQNCFIKSVFTSFLQVKLGKLVKQVIATGRALKILN